MPGRLMRGALILILAATAGGCNDSLNVTGPGTTGSATPRPPSAGQSVKFVGFDANPTLTESLQQGKIQGLVLQNPYQMGDLGLRTTVVNLEKGEVKSRIGTGEKVATPENISKPAIAELLNPPKDTSPPDTNKPGEKTKKWRVMIIPKATANEFWQTVHAGADAAAKELDNVEVLWRGPEKEDDYTKQIELIESGKSLGVDGIVLAPIDSKALVSPVEQSIDNGIPVVIIDSNLESMRTVSFVGTDNYHGGVLAAKRMADVLGNRGNVILMRHMVGSDSTEQREKGFLETLGRYPEIKIISQNQYAGATTESATKTAQDLITLYKGQVDGIFCSNEQATMGMLKGLEEAGLVKGQP